MLNNKISDYHSSFISIMNKLMDTINTINHDGLKITADDLVRRSEDPFMFVIVGEVKAGKSSFVNALLESKKEICKVAASPMTDTIQQIVYGEKEQVIELSPYLKRITQPVEILKDIAIVDTPGTNTIIDHHQEITEKFIPLSDLIVFVFEAKNPYRQSSWAFFKFINKEWHKKIIFVLQQKDLLNQEDLTTNIIGVTEHAKKEGIMDPIVFPVSALLEQQGHSEISGFKKVRNYIATNITNGRGPYLKIESNLRTLININEKIFSGVKDRKEQYESDYNFRGDIKQSLDHQEAKTKRQVGILVTSLLAEYDRITQSKREELKNGIGFTNLISRSIKATFGGGQKIKDWLSEFKKDLEVQLNLNLKDQLQSGVIDIADNIQNMGKIIDLKIKNSETILKDNHEIFADIAERRSNVLKELHQAFSGFLNRTENFYNEEMIHEGSSFVPKLAKSSGMAIIGVVLTALTNTMVFDITGGILTTIGVVFTGITIGLNKGKILSSYDNAIEHGRRQIESEITQKLNSYTTNIKDKIEDNFYKFDQLLEFESKTIQELEDANIYIQDASKELMNKVNSEIQSIE